MRQDVLDRFVSELSRSSEHTRKHQTFYAGKFLQYAGDRPLSEWNQELVRQFLDELEGEGYASGSRRMIYSIVKRVYDCAKAVHEAERTRLISQVDPEDPAAVAQLVKAISLPAPTWDLGKRSAPKVEKAVTGAMSLEELQAMVQFVKSDGQPDMAAFLALASVYGLRREEIASVGPEDISDHTLWVDTLKGGEKRQQLLAPEIVPYLKEHDFSQRYSPTSMTTLYYKIEHFAGVPHRYGAGWHAIRHLVDTTLVNVHGELITHIFMRWKISSSSLMVERYFNQDPLETDKVVLANHPLLDLWKE
ncbi:MAG: hypothetical protein WC551_08305 [Patescibacteria group bacterium]